MERKQRLAVLGSTGSIGTQTLDIVRNYPERFEITTLTAHSNWEALAAQAVEFAPRQRRHCKRTFLYPPAGSALVATDQSIRRRAGARAGGTLGSGRHGSHGSGGLQRALPDRQRPCCTEKKVALANKECLVVAGGNHHRALGRTPGADPARRFGTLCNFPVSRGGAESGRKGNPDRLRRSLPA